MSVAVVTQEDHEAALKRIAALERIVANLPGAGRAAPARDFLTPRDVARRFTVADALVYAALASGKLPAEKRQGSGKAAPRYRIQLEDARTWYATFVPKSSNQGGQP